MKFWNAQGPRIIMVAGADEHAFPLLGADARLDANANHIGFTFDQPTTTISFKQLNPAIDNTFTIDELEWSFDPVLPANPWQINAPTFTSGIGAYSFAFPHAGGVGDEPVMEV